MLPKGLYQIELRSLKKDVENSGLLLEREVLQHWMNDIRSSVTIQTTIQSVLKEEGKKHQTFPMTGSSMSGS